jgi:hypothetical protein
VDVSSFGADIASATLGGRKIVGDLVVVLVLDLRGP